MNRRKFMTVAAAAAAALGLRQRTVEAEMARVEGRADLETFLQERTNRVPLGRRAEVSEVVDSILWLVLDAPDYITCARLNVSGGLDKD